MAKHKKIKLSTRVARSNAGKTGSRARWSGHTAATKNISARVSDDIYSALKSIGRGSVTRGIKTTLEFYLTKNRDFVEKVDDKKHVS